VSETNTNVRTNEDGYEQCLAVNDVVTLLREKWTILIMGALSRNKSLRYNELQRAVVGISQRMLTLSLKTLEENGLVKRTIFATVPPRVDYELTDVGRTLVTPLRGLLAWSLEHRTAMADARRAYAARSSDIT
jgi:DNA-binding HxlR family transcriptional regulator